MSSQAPVESIGAKNQVILGTLKGPHQAIHHLRVHPLENPRIIGVQQPDAVGSTARKRPRPKVRAVSHFVGKSADTFRRFDTAPMGFFDVAPQDSRDR